MKEMALPKLHEGLLNEEWHKVEFDAKVKQALRNPFTRNYMRIGMKEGILRDMAGVLGRMHDVVVEAAEPNLIARDIIDVRTTTRRTPHRALTEFRLCKEFGWTPCELGRQSAKTVEEFVLILSEADRQVDEEMTKVKRESRLRVG